MSIILAKIFGLYFLALGLAFLVNPERFRRIFPNVVNNDTFLLFGALFAVLIGAFIVSVHNEWVFSWPVIITILGWWSLIKGFGLLIHPDFIKYFSFMQNRSDLFYRSISIAYLVIGAFLTYKGFIS